MQIKTTKTYHLKTTGQKETSFKAQRPEVA